MVPRGGRGKRRGDERPGTTEARAHEAPPLRPRARGTRDDVADAAGRASRRADPATRNTRADDMAALAHDLRGPLSIIMLETSVLAELANELGAAAVKGHCDQIQHNVEYMARLVADLLDLASSDAGQLRLSPARAELGGLVRAVLGATVPSRDRGRVVLAVRKPVHALVDAARIERVIANLIGNALAYTPPESLISVAVEARDGRAHVSVSDTGPGLSAEEARTVFERYRRGPRGGYGLGLYVCRRIIELHGGEISVTSTPMHGARFLFDLALAP